MNVMGEASAALHGLKDFQRRTVDYTFSRMFATDNPARRFLVADEVGLGKTLVAKGLIARTIEHLKAKGERIDVIYVCSNADIAAQNIARLMLPGQPSFARATRLTLLPLVTEQLRAHPVNYISFTPGTTFTQNSRTGRKEERRLVYQMLREIPTLDARGLRNAMKGTAGDGWFVEADAPLTYDADIASAYRLQLSQRSELFAELHAVAEIYRDRRRSISEADAERCLRLTGSLRRELAKTCLKALQPDLVILDEFQRFAELFDDPDKNPSAELAHELFNYSQDLRVLLLSATPYKMFAADEDEEDHYADFLRTLSFLMPGAAARLQALKDDIAEFRTGLLSVQSEGDLDALSGTKARIESSLRTVMCRTERVGFTVRADAMVSERLMLPQLEARDLRDFRWLEAVGKRLGEADALEYWKSSPYLLNFMREYSYKHALRADSERKASLIVDLIAMGRANLLQPSSIANYERLDPGNPRLRALQDELDSQGLWRLLWMPPSMAYWKPAGPYDGLGSITKHLIFSAWNVVPDALAALLSYEVERRIVEESGVRSDHAAMPKRFAARLRFSRQRDGRLGGMAALMLMFPSRALVEIIDPLKLVAEVGATPTFDQVRQRAASLLAASIESHVDRSVVQGPVDRRWYWVALTRLEASRHPDSRTWCEYVWRHARSGTDDEEHDADSAFQAHVDHWLESWDGNVGELGRVPPDLYEVLAGLALAGPATCALRTLSRHWPLTADVLPAAFSAATRIAEGLRSQFNAPRAVGLLKAIDDDDSYWQRVLQYGADGNLQAVLDEYVHVLVESSGLGGTDPQAALTALAAPMFDAMSLRTATLRPEEVSTTDGRVQIEPFGAGLRSNFALRFGGKNDEEGAVSRKETVQAAFNSPFWPFVLISTSVGQEGLDFHTWCHSVIHWNLPSNPVDLEQREGRVHRYKGYAVRKNAARRYGDDILRQGVIGGSDPWEVVFHCAVAGRPKDSNDLVPFWVLEVEGGAKIERRIMLLPLSRDESKYHRLRRSLALYRMVFAQPRQEDLLACLEQAIGEHRAAAIAERWRIYLAPPSDAALYSRGERDGTGSAESIPPEAGSDFELVTR